ncbi:MAG: hypothetical protein UT71_C0004G0014 [Parcubacteria group bacterium GW2011_GWF2_40_10]|nr:MAG: hypothetical protein UT71_C0004G0014 [Parcubacteria group bacterium GW2011_GWF2_40_10]
MNQKQLFKEKLSSFEEKANNRFELTEKFLKANITNAELANEGIPEEILREFKKVGSNRTVLFEPRGAWKTLLDSEFGGGNALVSRLRRDPISALKSDFVFWRRGRDSNSREDCSSTAFRERRFRPLSHLSIRFMSQIFFLTEKFRDPGSRFLPLLRKTKTSLCLQNCSRAKQFARFAQF